MMMMILRLLTMRKMLVQLRKETKARSRVILISYRTRVEMKRLKILLQILKKKLKSIRNLKKTTKMKALKRLTRSLIRLM